MLKIKPAVNDAVLILLIIALLILTTALVSSAASLYFEVKFWGGLRDDNTGGRWPSVTIIMPVRGIDQNLEGNIRSVLNQRYPAEREYLFIIDDAEDPAHELIRGITKNRGDARIIINEGGSSKGSALARGISEARGDVVVLVDSDAYVHEEWLMNLVKPLMSGAGASTTYRFYLPLRGLRLGDLLRASFNMIGITAMQNEVARFTWGGSTAIWRSLLLKWNVAKYLPHYLSDDYVLTHMVHREGLRITFTPSAMVLTLENVGLRDAFNWSVRQLWYVKVYGFRGFALYAASYTLYAITLPVAVATAIYVPWALVIGLAPYLIGVIKDYYRISRIKSLNSFYSSLISRHYSLILALASIINVYFSWIVILFTAFTREINWRGRVFTISDVERGIREAPLP